MLSRGFKHDVHDPRDVSQFTLRGRQELPVQTKVQQALREVFWL